MKRTLNTTINRSKSAKNDECYTQPADIGTHAWNTIEYRTFIFNVGPFCSTYVDVATGRSMRKMHRIELCNVDSFCRIFDCVVHLGDCICGRV